MKSFLYILCVISSLGYLSQAQAIPTSDRAERAIKSVEPILKKSLSAKGLRYGAPVYIRIFKEDSILELWVKNQAGEFVLFKKFAICYYSGDLGPKTKVGDNQAPEGFYFVGPNSLNPWSQFHLSFNLGYPNSYDRYHRRTGSALMVHGNCVSIGCYAMTDKNINEIYALGLQALKQGQPFFRVHIFPFQMTEENMERFTGDKWYSFWQNLKQGYDFFEEKRVPPNVKVEKGVYVFN